VAGGVAVIAVVLLVGAFWRVPYFTVAPGSLRATEPLISVEGAPSYPDDAGEIGYLTVTFGQTTPFGLVRAWIDGDIEVLSEDQALGGLDRDENREVNEALMTNAKDTATAVALDALGYDVELLGTGSIVIQVEDGTPAVGVVQPGDVIVSVDGEPVTTAVELTDLLATAVPGQEVLLGVQPQAASMMVGHAGAQPPATTKPEREVPVTLAERPDEPGRAYLGVRSATRDATYNLPFDVTIDSGNVIGPSAGLAFTLAVIDVLTPGNLTGGSTVAVTGTISPSGQRRPWGPVQRCTWCRWMRRSRLVDEPVTPWRWCPSPPLTRRWPTSPRSVATPQWWTWWLPTGRRGGSKPFGPPAGIGLRCPRVRSCEPPLTCRRVPAPLVQAVAGSR
jgi:PDZ domain-containing protein